MKRQVLNLLKLAAILYSKSPTDLFEYLDNNNINYVADFTKIKVLNGQISCIQYYSNGFSRMFVEVRLSNRESFTVDYNGNVITFKVVNITKGLFNSSWYNLETMNYRYVLTLLGEFL